MSRVDLFDTLSLLERPGMCLTPANIQHADVPSRDKAQQQNVLFELPFYTLETLQGNEKPPGSLFAITLITKRINFNFIHLKKETEVNLSFPPSSGVLHN